MAILLSSVAINTFFGMPYIILLPVFVQYTLHGGATATALLMAANGFGALVGALGVAYMARVAHRPTLIRYGLVAFASSTAGVALSRSLWLTTGLMVVAGAAFLTIQSACNAGLQAYVPNWVRGRVMALFVLAFMGVMPFSGLVFGMLGDRIGVPAAILIGSAFVLLWGIVLIARRRLLAEVE